MAEWDEWDFIKATSGKRSITMSKDLQEGQKLLNEKVAEFNNALLQAEAIADEYGLEFSISPSYGMGGYYEGAESEWYASSQSC